MRRVLVLGSSLFFVACAMQRPATSPSRVEPALPSTPAPAASAAPVVDGDVAPTSAPAATKAPVPAGAGGSAATGTVVMPGELASAQARFDEASKAFAASGTDCLSLCKSLVSMTNATDHLCGLVQGTTDEPRCTDARARLQAAQAKVKTTCGNTCG